MITPYAVLLCRPNDSDDVIRKAFHAEAQITHPDLLSVPDPENREARWQAALAAYNAIKTQQARDAFETSLRLLANLCFDCGGFGVAGTRLAGRRIRVCDACKGEGRRS